MMISFILDHPIIRHGKVSFITSALRSLCHVLRGTTLQKGDILHKMDRSGETGNAWRYHWWEVGSSSACRSGSCPRYYYAHDRKRLKSMPSLLFFCTGMDDGASPQVVHPTSPSAHTLGVTRSYLSHLLDDTARSFRSSTQFSLPSWRRPSSGVLGRCDLEMKRNWKNKRDTVS
jgi:hypothetical protein